MDDLSKRNGRDLPQIQIDGADVRYELLGLEVKLAKVFYFECPHLGTYEMLQEVIEHRDDPFSQERVHEDPLDFCKQTIHVRIILPGCFLS